jgi:endonuclease-3
MTNMLLTEYGGQVPSDMDDLLRLPGVGRKSANLIRGDVFGLPAVVADTHCIRLANRIGFVTNDTDPVHVERALEKVLPPEESNDFCHRCVMHGRAVCTARKPMCQGCCLQDLCRMGRKTIVKE